MDLKNVLKQFALLPAPSGYEKPMAYALRDAFKPYADEVMIDRVGNTIARIAGTDADAPVVMIYAHVDQLGFIVRKIESNGFLQVERLGGVPEKILPALSLLVRSEDETYYPGVFAVKSHHATPPEEKYKVDTIGSMFVDIGAKSADEVRELGIEVGCPAVYKPQFQELMGGRVSGTALDDRGGCASMVKIAELLHDHRPQSTVFLVGTVWEEFNLRGAMMAARTIKPDIAICLDVVLSGDTADLAAKYDVALGAGPAVNLYSFHGRGTLNGTIVHERLRDLAVDTARRQNIPLQRFASVGILTDSAYLQLEGQGVASIEMGYPARYTHSPVETCDIADLEALSALVAEMVQGIDAGFELNRF